MPGTTPSQTVGPYFSIGLPWEDGEDVVATGTPGTIRVHGRLLDGEGEPVPDGLIETWQADAEGRFTDPDAPGGPSTAEGFRGFGRSGTDAGGAWGINTIKPGAVAGADGAPQAPHIAVSVFSRGLLVRLVTRIYFADEAEANAADPALASLPDDAARATLVAQPDRDGYRLDIRLQGEGETVFFDV
jgi:protocatechuate 3,4-dioxygenase alpha subunit